MMCLRVLSSARALLIVLVLGLAATQSAQAQTFTVLHSFAGFPSDGKEPYAGLVRDGAGNLYGTTINGGHSDYGTVFEVSKTGTETVLRNFALADGDFPSAGLILDAAGNLYGTTDEGEFGSSGYGTVFELTKAGQETVLHNFAGYPSDGGDPVAGLIQDTEGNLYGTAYSGGNHLEGTVFELSETGKETVLHSFKYSDGANPSGSLILDAAGNFYGTTQSGGHYGYGTVFKLNKTGNLTVLHSFAGGTADGCFPGGTPVMDARGNLFGTAELCGSSDQGIVWKVSTKGAETVLHNFTGGSLDGAYPYAGVIMDTKGNFYGDTVYGGSSGFGTVYELNTKGKLTLLHSFTGPDGEFPLGGLLRDAKGSLYGTAEEGGSDDFGTVWELTP
jgi:uncharacterized repeat protein (TIGR03803 family)